MELLRVVSEKLINSVIANYPVEDILDGGEFQRGMLSGYLCAYEMMVPPEDYRADTRVRAAEALLTKMAQMLHPKSNPVTPPSVGLPPMHEQGVAPQCHCLKPLPCLDHPAPPKLSFVGGTHFADNPQYKRTEDSPVRPQGTGSDKDGGGNDAECAGCDDGGWPARDRAVASSASGDVDAPRAAVHQENLPGPVPLHVAEASQRISHEDTSHRAEEPDLLMVPSSCATVDVALAVAAKMKLPNILILSEADDGTLHWVSTPMDLAGTNWLLDRMKAIIMAPADG